MKDSVTKRKNTLEGMRSRISDIEEGLSDVEDRMLKSPNQNTKKEKQIFKK